jgi:rod shape-determining protein MreC
MKKRLSKWKTTVMVGAIIVSTLTIMALDVQGTKGTTWVESVVVSALAPIQKAITRTSQKTHHLWESYVNLVNVQAENENLREEIQALRGENNRLVEENLRHQRLSDLLQVQKKAKEPMLLANVVGHDSTTWSNVLVVDRGTEEKVGKKMVVVSADGLVGHVIQTSPKASKVLLLTDFRHSVDALIQRTRDRGVVAGRDRYTCLMNYIPLEADVKVGDRVITSGMGGLFPKGLVIGTVIHVTKRKADLYQEALVKPSADLMRLEEVFVIVKR